MTPLIDHFQQFATYNMRANSILYGACSKLADVELKRDRQAFFSSIHGTLNHIMVGDRIWLARFEGGEAPSVNLDAIFYDEFDALRAARQKEDERIIRVMSGLDDAFCERRVTYVNNAGVEITDQMTVLLSHFFNHQTHHRGQIHHMLGEAGQTPPSLDLHRLINPVELNSKPANR